MPELSSKEFEGFNQLAEHIEEMDTEWFFMSTENSNVKNNGILNILERWAAIIALLGLSFTWDQLLSLPRPVYLILFGLVGIWVLVRVLFSMKKNIVNYRDSKQEEYLAMPFFISGENLNLYRSEWETYEGLKWLIETERFDGHLNDIAGPFCPQDHTKMISRKTFLGRYEYECSTCLLKVRKDYDSHTLESRLRRVAEARINF